MAARPASMNRGTRKRRSSGRSNESSSRFSPGTCRMNSDEPSRDAFSLPRPPETLACGQVTLRFGGILPGNEALGLVPSYHFRIQDLSGTDVGHLNFRVGDTEHVRIAAGHIG